MDERTSAIASASRARRIHATPAVSEPGWQGVSVGMSVDELERFLDTLIRRPISEDDGLAMRIFGRGQDLTAADTPWRFELMPGLAPTDLIRMHVIVNVPDQDVDEVIDRLRALQPID